MLTIKVRSQVSPLDGALSILASYDGAFEDIGFTIAVYSAVAVSWDKPIPRAPFTIKVNQAECRKRKVLHVHLQVDGALTVKSAGGNCTYPTFMMNPQYHLHIHPERQPGTQSNLKSRLELVLQGDRDIPLNMMVVWSQGERIFEWVFAEWVVLRFLLVVRPQDSAKRDRGELRSIQLWHM